LKPGLNTLRGKVRNRAGVEGRVTCVEVVFDGK
jgi:hypothetical protein